MGLPFLKNKEGGASYVPDSKTLDTHPDDDKEMDLLDACAEDIISAIHKKDVKMLKEALESLIIYIQELDAEQDAEDMV